jgi:hypothetical protein
MQLSCGYSKKVGLTSEWKYLNFDHLDFTKGMSNYVRAATRGDQDAVATRGD